MSTVTVRDLRVSYNRGKAVAVEHVSFDVQDGEFCILLGPSGCGKSTVLHSIAGLIRPDAGEISIGGKVVTGPASGTHTRPQDRNIAMVFQEYALYPNLTVRKNMAFPLESRGLQRGEIRTKVESTARVLGIDDLLDRRPAQLSGGQRQRVALGRALVRDPDVFLFDEPLGNIDAKLRVQVRYELKSIQKQLGVTMVYVTHDQVEAMAMGDSVVLMNGGRVAQTGTPTQLYVSPADLFVAGFLGMPPINLFPCRLTRTADSVELVADGFALPLTGQRAEALAVVPDGQALTLGVRPSDVARAPAGSEAQVSLHVDTVEPGGDTVVAHGHIAGSAVTAKWPATTAVTLGDVPVRLLEEAVHVFDPETGRALI